MIFNALFKSITMLLMAVFSVFPALPAMPEVITNNFNGFLAIISNGVGFIKWLLSPDLFNVVIVITVALINFEYIFNFVMFVIRKLPIGVK